MSALCVQKTTASTMSTLAYGNMPASNILCQAISSMYYKATLNACRIQVHYRNANFKRINATDLAKDGLHAIQEKVSCN